MGNQSVMRYLIVFTVLLLVARFGQGVTVTFNETLGGSVRLESVEAPSDDFECFLTHNNDVYQIHPVNNLTFGIKTYDTFKCDYSLNPLAAEHAGPWKMTISWDTTYGEKVEQNSEYEIYITQDVNTAYQTLLEDSSSSFSTRFITKNGTYITVYPEKEPDFVFECLLFHVKDYNDEDVYDLLDFTQTSPSMEIYKNCGVRMLVNSSRTGRWYIKQKISEYLYEKFYFDVQIPIQPVYKSQENLLWLLGSSQEIEVKGLSESVYCNVTRPDKKTILVNNHRCSYYIPKVGLDHEGLWIVQYLVPENINIMEKKFIVEIRDPDFVNVSIDSDYTRLKLMCKMARKNSDFCIFTRPDGVAINLPQGIGNNKYEYYGNGYKQHLPKQETDTECGLTIYEPMLEDFGLWKCSLGQNGNVISAYVPVPYGHELDSNYVFPSENIYVKRDDDFTIKCRMLTQLQYCWLLSPNGTIYSVSKNKNLDNTLTYEGEGLNLGVCGAKIENASDAHMGNWSCRMGTDDGIEKEVPFMVTVTESYMYMNQSVINISSSDTNIRLGCNVLPTKEATLRYCRWVRPGGYGIHTEESIHYKTSQGVRTCSLEIREYNELNIGNWSCYARLSDDLDTEVFATIEINLLEDKSTSALSTAIICLVTIIPIMFFIAGLIIYKKKLFRRRRTNNIDYTNNEIDVQIAQEKPKI